ncbi:uncharacterized protein N7477_002066 [Penicillium maclennaniae]|uniref:uncharacterized protein n=1 Tax=Penicillium maclennaniae TaxID=1343394 RepID=UPI002540ED6C|nr:uncharacterized protein N7477_002066 [Penicillium maclennaniae]KAJ5682126.1 hypothetical protein N7477_002066 [Penicillium maclennaniae]
MPKPIKLKPEPTISALWHARRICGISWQTHTTDGRRDGASVGAFEIWKLFEDTKRLANGIEKTTSHPQLAEPVPEAVQVFFEPA